MILLDAGGGTLICRMIDSLTTPVFAQCGLSRTVVRILLNDAYAPGNSPDMATVKRYHVGLCNYVASVELPFEGGEFVGWTPDDETIERLFR